MKSDISYKRILKIALPIMVSNATIPLLGIVDTGVVGQMGDATLVAAVGIGAIVISVLFWLFGFLRMGTTGLVAQARGECDEKEICAILFRGLIIGFIGGFLLITFQSLIINISFQIFPVATEVSELSKTYLEIRIWAAPFSIATFACVGWLIAVERTGSILILQVITNGLNILLDLWFVLILDYGVKGVGLASLLAESSGFFLAFYLCARERMLRNQFDLARISEKSKWSRMFVLNYNILIRSLILELVLASYIFIGSTFGTITLAANQVLLHFMHLTAFALDGFAFSAEALVGIAVGQRSKDKIRVASIRSSMLAFTFALCLATLFYIFGPLLIDRMVLDVAVQQVAKEYLFWMTLTPITGFASFMLDGIFLGATQSVFMRKAMFQSFIFYLISILIFYSYFDNHGLWLSINLFFIVRAISLLRYYRRIERLAV